MFPSLSVSLSPPPHLSLFVPSFDGNGIIQSCQSVLESGRKLISVTQNVFMRASVLDGTEREREKEKYVN